MYTVTQTVINSTSDLHGYCGSNALLACNLYNAALFRIRQVFTGYDKPARTQNEKDVFDEVTLLEETYPSIRVKRVISYSHLEKLMRVTVNPDFYAGLPMQTAQHVVKQACTDFKNWLKALRAFKSGPGKFTGRPKMPHYKKKQGFCNFTFTNQDAVLYPVKEDGVYSGMQLKLPKTGKRLALSGIPEDAVLKEAKVKPYYGRFLLCLTMETQDVAVDADMPYTAAVDFGVDNLAAIVCNDGSSKIYKGGAVLSENQWFAKQKAHYTGIITKGHSRMHASSKRLDSLSFHHANFNRDKMHKVSADIVRWCISHRAGTLVLGVNRYWKQETAMGSVSNQNFVSVPLATLRAFITYKAIRAGITVVEQEESYTSKADITSMDYIPVYGKDDEKASFSGSRVKRGLYKCADGLVINADCNGAANIMRKAFPDVWKDVKDFSFLASPEVSGFHELNPLSIPVKGIAAA